MLKKVYSHELSYEISKVYCVTCDLMLVDHNGSMFSLDKSHPFISSLDDPQFNPACVAVQGKQCNNCVENGINRK